ncbi:UNVERIFIED_CONTAM: hypothetical protein FKN15_009744 [Acipenser sinensis]
MEIRGKLEWGITDRSFSASLINIKHLGTQEEATPDMTMLQDGIFKAKIVFIGDSDDEGEAAPVHPHCLEQTNDIARIEPQLQICSPAQLRQQSEELYATIDQVLEEPMPMVFTEISIPELPIGPFLDDILGPAYRGVKTVIPRKPFLFLPLKMVCNLRVLALQAAALYLWYVSRLPVQY